MIDMENGFNSRNQAIKTLTDMTVNGLLNHEIFVEVESKAATIKVELEKVKKAEQEKRHLYDITQSIPEIQYPKKWSLRYAGQIYIDELNDYIASRDIGELEEYLVGLQNGGCVSEDFRNKSGFEATAYLSAAIRRRKAAPKSTETQPSAKDIENFNATADKLSKKQIDLEKQMKKMSTPAGTEKSKAYTA